MGLVVMEHPDGRRRVYPARDADHVVALLHAADWTPDPKCPCCKVKVVTVDNATFTATAIETIYAEPD